MSLSDSFAAASSSPFLLQLQPWRDREKDMKSKGSFAVYVLGYSFNTMQYVNVIVERSHRKKYERVFFSLHHSLGLTQHPTAIRERHMISPFSLTPRGLETLLPNVSDFSLLFISTTEKREKREEKSPFYSCFSVKKPQM